MSAIDPIVSISSNGVSRRMIALAFVGASFVWPASAAAQVPGPPPLPPKEEPKPKPTPTPTDPGPTQQAEPEPQPKGPPPASEKPAFSKEAVARVEAIQKEAEKYRRYGDHLTAADMLEQAYLLIPDPNLAYRIGDAAHKAKDCARALRYYETFLDGSEFADSTMIKAAQKGANELRTFDCPPRTPDDENALVTTLVADAQRLTKEKDVLGAAFNYARAYQAVPTRPVLAYEVGVAAWNAHLCGDAVSYFYHFIDVADPRANARELKQARKYIDDSEAGKCQPWTDAARSQHARELFDQGQTHEFGLDYLGAAGKYARAYEVLPANVVIAYQAAEMYWRANWCAQAEPLFRNFVANADDRFAKERAESESILARIDAHGCPTALWNKDVSGVRSGDGSNDGGTQEGPPPVKPKGNSTVACTMVDEPGRGWGATGLVIVMFGMMLGSRGRRRFRPARGR